MKFASKIRTGHAIQSWALHVLVAAALFTASCAEAPGTPTAPSARAGTLSATPQALGDADATMSLASTHAVLLLTKICDAADHCKVEMSSSGPIPALSDINYFGPLLAPRTTSRIVVTTPAGDTAEGHCSVGDKKWEGTCVITDGTGALAGLHANVKVSPDSVLNPVVFTWEGRYHFEP